MAALPDPWVAVDPVSDRVAHARALRRVHDAVVSGATAPAGLRAVVAQSWRRSGAAGIDPARHLAPIVLDDRELEARWHAHPLFPVLPVLRELLTAATAQAAHMMVISDARGVLLWMEGHQRVIEATEDMHFVCGADWSEAGAGTNALGTAIAVDHPVQIFSAEHFNRLVHPWQCSGAPIHDPVTGEILGVIDLTGHLRTAHPHTLALVAAAAGMAEAFLRARAAEREAHLRERYLARVGGRARRTALVGPGGRVLAAVPHGWAGEHVDVPPDGGEVRLADGRLVVAEPLGEGGHVLWASGRDVADVPPLRPRLELGAPRPRAVLGGRVVELSPRHADLLGALARHPEGLSAEALAAELYGTRGKAVTVRAELSRLRRRLGPVLRTRPYRLADEVDTDLPAGR
ncbi:MAG TPA: GAF domain-containing protein [Baekduia sp.]|nr:GAF domain-containing protein [Baekduia sp.]